MVAHNQNPNICRPKQEKGWFKTYSYLFSPLQHIWLNFLSSELHNLYLSHISTKLVNQQQGPANGPHLPPLLWPLIPYTQQLGPVPAHFKRGRKTYTVHNSLFQCQNASVAQCREWAGYRVSWYFWLCMLSVHLICWSTVQPVAHQLGGASYVKTMSVDTGAIFISGRWLTDCNGIYMFAFQKYYPTDLEKSVALLTPTTLRKTFLLDALYCYHFVMFVCQYGFHPLFSHSG